MTTLSADRVTFARYMEQALYGPRGYYSTGRARSGKRGDYFTAPDVGPLFGQLLAGIFQSWQAKLNLDSCHWVEVGAGEGVLAQSLTSAAPDVPYLAIERSPARQAYLRTFGFNSLPSLEHLRLLPVSGILFGNELLDAFPVHRVRMHNGQLQEAYMDPELEWDAPSTPRLAAYFERIGVELPEGHETEINLAMADWFHVASQALDQGLIVLIDYGRPAHEYYAPERERGTLRGFQRHQIVDSLLGGDITADVDFTSAALDAEAAGLQVLAYMEMGSFLMQAMSQEQRAMSDSSLIAHRSALQFLIHPDGLGTAFQVLILGKNVPLTPEDFPNNRLQRLGLKGVQYAASR